MPSSDGELVTTVRCWVSHGTYHFTAPPAKTIRTSSAAALRIEPLHAQPDAPDREQERRSEQRPGQRQSEASRQRGADPSRRGAVERDRRQEISPGDDRVLPCPQ